MIRCDVCGELILGIIDRDERIHSFKVNGLVPDKMLHCDNACKQAMVNAGKDWRQLPAGPLRTAYETASAEGDDRETDG